MNTESNSSKYNPIVQSLGGMTLNASNLESMLIGLCASLINPKDHEVQNVLKATLNVRIAVKVIKTILSLKLEEEKADHFIQTIINAKKALDKRNTIVHSFYYQESPEPNSPMTRLKFRVKGKSGVNIDEEKLEEENVNEVTLEIMKSMQEIGSMGIKLIELGFVNRKLYYGSEE